MLSRATTVSSHREKRPPPPQMALGRSLCQRLHHSTKKRQSRTPALLLPVTAVAPPRYNTCNPSTTRHRCHVRLNQMGLRCIFSPLGSTPADQKSKNSSQEEKRQSLALCEQTPSSWQLNQDLLEGTDMTTVVAAASTNPCGGCAPAKPVSSADIDSYYFFAVAPKSPQKHVVIQNPSLPSPPKLHLVLMAVMHHAPPPPPPSVTPGSFAVPPATKAHSPCNCTVIA